MIINIWVAKLLLHSPFDPTERLNRFSEKIQEANQQSKAKRNRKVTWPTFLLLSQFFSLILSASTCRLICNTCKSYGMSDNAIFNCSKSAWGQRSPWLPARETEREGEGWAGTHVTQLLDVRSLQTWLLSEIRACHVAIGLRIILNLLYL